jgi:hypothetical protein
MPKWRLEMVFGGWIFMLGGARKWVFRLNVFAWWCSEMRFLGWFFLLGGDQKLWSWGVNIFALWQSKMVFWVRCFCFGGEQFIFFHGSKFMLHAYCKGSNIWCLIVWLEIVVHSFGHDFKATCGFNEDLCFGDWKWGLFEVWIWFSGIHALVIINWFIFFVFWGVFWSHVFWLHQRGERMGYLASLLEFCTMFVWVPITKDAKNLQVSHESLCVL